MNFKAGRILQFKKEVGRNLRRKCKKKITTITFAKELN